MKNILEVELRAKDLITGAIGSWVGNWRKDLGELTKPLARGSGGSVSPNLPGVLPNVGSQGQRVGEEAGRAIEQGLRGSIGGLDLGTLIKADLLLRLVDTVANSLMAIPGYIQGALSDAVAAEGSAITAATSLSRSLGISMTEAKNVVARMNEGVAQVAADLPGTTENYTRIQTSIMGSIAGVLKEDQKMFEQVTGDITKRVGLMAAETRYDPNLTASGIQKLIGGASTIKSIIDNDVFERVPDFKVGMEQGLKQLGVTALQWQELTSKQRLAVVSYALQFATPDSKINELKKTADSIIEGWKSSLFDPQLGVFGVRNKVESRDGRTVFDAFSSLLRSLDDLKNAAVPLLSKLGIGDPMAVLVDLFDWLSGLTQKVTAVLSKGGLGDMGSPGDAVAGLIKAGYGVMANVFNSLWSGLGSLFDNIDWYQTGITVGRALVASAFAFRDFLLSIDYSTVARVILTGLGGILKALVGFFIGLGQQYMLQIFSDAAALQSVVKDKFSEWLDLVLKVLSPAQLAQNLVWVFTELPKMLKSAFDGVIQAIQDVIQGILGLNPGRTPTHVDRTGRTILSAEDAKAKQDRIDANLKAKAAGQPLPYPEDMPAYAKDKPGMPGSSLPTPTTTNQAIQNNSSVQSNVTVTNQINASGMSYEQLGEYLSNDWRTHQENSLTAPR